MSSTWRGCKPAWFSHSQKQLRRPPLPWRCHEHRSERLPASKTVVGRLSAQPGSLSCHTQRGQPPPPTSERRQIGPAARGLWAVAAPRQAAGEAPPPGGCASSCGRPHSSHRGRSDPRHCHQHASCGRFSCACRRAGRHCRTSVCSDRPPRALHLQLPLTDLPLVRTRYLDVSNSVGRAARFMAALGAYTVHTKSTSELQRV